MKSIHWSHSKFIAMSLMMMAHAPWLYAQALPAPQSNRMSLKEAVMSVIEANDKATSYENWINSDKTPDQLFKKVASLAQEGNTKIVEQLCKTLDLLPVSDLALFSDAISSKKDLSLPCAEALTSKISHFFSVEKIKLRKLRDDKQQIQGGFSSFLNRVTSIASKEKPVDLTTTEVFTRGNLTVGQIGFTFDDGPHPKHTQEMVDILDAEGVRGLFFQLGQNAERYPDISRMLRDKNQVVGSHSITHPQLSKIPFDKAKEEILGGRSMVEKAIGMNAPFFRFPYGARNQTTQAFVKSQGMTTFFWNIDTLDWKFREPAVLMNNIIKELNREKGGIILFHDVHPQSVAVMQDVLEEIKERNMETYVFVPR